MNEQSRKRTIADERKLERAIILNLLGEDSGRRTSRAQLAAALDTDAHALEQAVERMAQAGLVCVAGAELWASGAARRLDQLGLIAI